MKSDVFVSYASDDRDRIFDLVARLRRGGVSVWIDQMGIEGATMWSQEIVEAIDACKVLILAISQCSTESENVVKELALASERRKNILPVCLDQSGVPKSMEYQLAGIQRVDYFEGNEEKGIEAINRALGKLDVTFAKNVDHGQQESLSSRGHEPNQNNLTKEKSRSVWPKVLIAFSSLAVSAIILFLLDTIKEDKDIPSALREEDYPKSPKTGSESLLDVDRVAVLPFKTIGTQGETSDLGYGLVSTLTNKLQPLQNLTIIAKESSKKFGDTSQSAKEIGQALGAGTLITGEILTDNEKVQVNIQLIDSNTDTLGWGSTFLDSKRNFLDLINEIATDVASELKGGLEAAEIERLAQKATESTEAHAEYQKGRREWNKRTREGFQNAITHFEKAISLDPEYANPRAGLADTYSLMPAYYYAPAYEVMTEAKSNAERAIELNPNLAEAYASLAWIQLVFDYDWLNSEKNFKKAISLNRNYATGHHWYGLFLNASGRENEGIEFLATAFRLEPTSLIIPTNLSQAYLKNNQVSLALEFYEIARNVSPEFPTNLWNFVRCQEKHDVSIEILKRSIIGNPEDPLLRRALFWAYAKNGETDKAKDVMIYSLDNFRDKMTLGFAEMYAALGNYDAALKWIRKAISEKALPMVFLPISYEFPAELISDSRFVDLMKSINNPLYK